MERFLTKWDLVLIAAVAALCALLIWRPLGRDGALTAEIIVDGQTVRTIVLDRVEQPYEITLPTTPPATLRVERGRICYIAAECPDHLCVRSGWLDRAGDTAACLPGKSMVVLRSSGERVFQTY